MSEDPSPLSIEILHQDEFFIAVNKPSGVLSQPNPGKDEESILSLIQNSGFNLIGGEDPARQGLIHRLDRDTSGLLLLSLQEEAHQKFQELFKKKEPFKKRTISQPSGV